MYRRRPMRPMVRRLMQMAQDPDPAVRLQAVDTLGTLRNPRALWGLSYLAQNDPDANVRQHAQRFVDQRRGASTASSQPVVWDCVFCGTRDITGSACPNCAAPRPTQADEQAAAAVSQNDQYRVPSPFGAARMGPMMGPGARQWAGRQQGPMFPPMFLFMVIAFLMLGLFFVFVMMR